MAKIVCRSRVIPVSQCEGPLCPGPTTPLDTAERQADEEFGQDSMVPEVLRTHSCVQRTAQAPLP
jgi:hypothetical protein